ncbi:MAG: chemotaxis response regulator protein-glutamate methylesterase [Proteobacteria bacterium]|nr:chemotaxis response regulator protein-glutamate methylesterase [Pseudomonadota bacterium]
MADEIILRVMVVDDTVLYRKILSDALKAIPGVEVVGSASNGQLALDKMASLNPDVMTLDIEMPVLNGLDTMRRMHAEHPRCDVIMVSGLSSSSATATTEALQHGAIHFITKPSGGDPTTNSQLIKQQFTPVIEGIRLRKKRPLVPATPAPIPRPIVRDRSVAALRGDRANIVAIGLSTGGPQALSTLIPMLPASLRVPVVITIHMPPTFTATVAESLNRKSTLTVSEGKNGCILESGNVYIAPGDFQMKVVPKTGSPFGAIKLTDDPAENNCKPSVDYLFRSVAHLHKGRALGIIMTGMGHDGVDGLRMMKRHGAKVIAQDETTSVVFGMPRMAIDAGVVDVVSPLNKIVDEILNALEHGF